MTQMDEIKIEIGELRSSIEGLRFENAKLRQELANFKAQANGELDHQSESNSPSEWPLFWAFIRGMGSVLEIYPSEGCFDRWRMRDSIPENDYALLFRDLWEATHPKKIGDEVES